MTQHLLSRFIVTLAKLFSATLLPIAAHAATLGDLFPSGVATCFVVRYSGKIHMHKKIGSVFLSQPEDRTRANTANELIMLELKLGVRTTGWKRGGLGSGNKFVKTVGLICHRQADDSWTCNEHTCNGHTVLLTALGPDRLSLNLQGDLTLQGACGSQDVEKQSILQLQRIDQVFTLDRVAPQVCR